MKNFNKLLCKKCGESLSFSQSNAKLKSILFDKIICPKCNHNSTIPFSKDKSTFWIVLTILIIFCSFLSTIFTGDINNLLPALPIIFIASFFPILLIIRNIILCKSLNWDRSDQLGLNELKKEFIENQLIIRNQELIDEKTENAHDNFPIGALFILIIILFVLVIITWVIFSFLNSDKYVGFYYPDMSNLSNNIQSTDIFDSLEACRDWVDEQVYNYNPNDYSYDYECGKNCNLSGGKPYICEETLQ